MPAHVELLAQWIVRPALGPLALIWGAWLLLAACGQMFATRAYIEETS